MLHATKSILTSFFILLVTTIGLAAQNLPELNLSNSGLALRGVDPVSYFTAGEPLQGNPEIVLEHEGGTYHFTSEDSRDQFKANPAKYLPAYGGYCAYGLAQGVKVDGDPNQWNIVDDQLYLNINWAVNQRWKLSKRSYIKTAEKKWPGLKHQ